MQKGKTADSLRRMDGQERHHDLTTSEQSPKENIKSYQVAGEQLSILGRKHLNRLDNGKASRN